MLTAAVEYPLKQVIGVEFSLKLDVVAKRDTAECESPSGDLVCSFYNSFGTAVLGPIADRLMAIALSSSASIRRITNSLNELNV